MRTSNDRSEMVMGQGTRKYVSLNPFNYLRRAPRLQSTTERVFQSGIELTDVSFYQKVIDFAKMKAAGIRGTVIRAGQNTWVDPYFLDNWRMAKQATLPRGSYWFMDSRTSVKAQADLYWSLIKSDVGELMVTADYEESYGGPFGGWKNLYDFTERLLGNGVPAWRLWIYSGYYYWLDHSPQMDANALAYFKKFKLWLPWYTSNPANVKQPKPWIDAGDVLLWQNGTPARGAELGVQTIEIDISQWIGDLASFNMFWLLGGVIPPPPTGGTMNYGKIKTLTNIRDSYPGGTYRDIGDLQAGDLIEADRLQPDANGVNWWHITRITSGGTNIPLPGPECWCWGTNVETVTAPPAVEAPPREVRVIMSDGTEYVATTFNQV